MATYFKEELDSATLELLADFICGDNSKKYPEYRTSTYLTKFFNDIGINVVHDGSTRKWWVLSILEGLSLDYIEKVILRLVDIREYKADREMLKMATEAMNDILFLENMHVAFNGRNPIISFLKTNKEPIINVIDNNDDHLEDQFLNKEFNHNISELKLETNLENILKNRINESNNCIIYKSYLSSVFMSGSALEGLLLCIAKKYPELFNKAKSSPKGEDGKVKEFKSWTLNDLINVSYEINFLDLDTKKFSHVLRDFRNYIHPHEQIVSEFEPSEHTAKICFQVLNSAIANLIKNINM